jgi:hypothetical protein
MGKLLKLALFGIIELLSYLFLREQIKYIGLSSFFAFWAIISIALPLVVYFNKSTSFLYNDVMHYQNVNFTRNPEIMAHSTGVKSRLSKSLNVKEVIINYLTYIVFLIYFLINVTAYIITQI